MLSFFPRGVLDEILNLIESVSEGFSSYSLIHIPTNENIRERERESVRVRECMRALLQYKALDAVLDMCPYLGTGMAQISLNIFAI